MSEVDKDPVTTRKAWNWLPPLPISEQPYFVWPVQPIVLIKHLIGRGFLLSSPGICILLAFIGWSILGPVERWATLELDWVAQVYALNLGIVIAVGGGLHLYFHSYALQGVKRKYSTIPQAKNDSRFFSNNQVRENIFFSCVSGITINTAYQVLSMWL
ncbi:MAG: hypothetical protein KTR18_01565 [Acidiferrobacterales bacterium]|nr:hypothetical protein [Acidiferrobacterales bacterium]